jgi:hypothetical protein
MKRNFKKSVVLLVLLLQLVSIGVNFAGEKDLPHVLNYFTEETRK